MNIRGFFTVLEAMLANGVKKKSVFLCTRKSEAEIGYTTEVMFDDGLRQLILRRSQHKNEY